MELESMDCLDDFIDNIRVGRENYEWDIISLFKIYNSFIENPPSGCPTCLCPVCMSVKRDYPDYYRSRIEIMKKTIYIMWFMKTITHESILELTKEFIKNRDGTEIREKINEYYQFLSESETIPDGLEDVWADKNDYYQELMDIPYMLNVSGVPVEHYLTRDLFYFNDMIASDSLVLDDNPGR